ncbi:MAG TPA: hypothetical protein VFP20_00905 [Bacteroidales bacterium]|nr:hypothetical protein [Bacteroidales bacterium]
MIGRLLVASVQLSIAALLFSCSSVSEVRPDDYLLRARQLIQKQQYQLAKIYVDSVRIRFPKEFAKIREGLSVLREINFAEQNRTLAFCDSMLEIRQNELPAAKSNFIFDKNMEYETVGHYVYKSQMQDNNLGRTFLQTKVDEKGNLVLTSYYCGSRALNHNRIHVSAPDGTYAETEVVPKDGALNYSFNDGGTRYEIVRFNRKTENGVINFVLLHQHQPVKVNLEGGSPKTYQLSKGDKQAMQAASNLSAILSDITKLLDEMRLAQAKLDYIYRKQNKIPDSQVDTSN